jgi:general stress protein YciG
MRINIAYSQWHRLCLGEGIKNQHSVMNNKNFDSENRRGFASMDPEKRRELAKKGGHASRKSERTEESDLAEASTGRGFAAMDEEKRRQIAKLGGSASRRNRIDWKNQGPVL